MSAGRIPLAVIVGPTASGKTALAIALAKEFDGEVVSADSMQLYRGMDIATAKPSVEEQEGIPHHLLDILEPSEGFSVAAYVARAGSVIADIHARGKLPILAGGTGLYVNSLVDGIRFEEAVGDKVVRARLLEEAERLGGEALLARLREVDPETAETLHPNNRNRLVRALEVWEVTGLPMSEHRRRSRVAPPPYFTCMLGLSYTNRQALYARINDRVDAMLEAGLREEASRMLASGLCGTAAQAIGYKELRPYFAGESPLADCVDRLKQETRRYAKRQLTWFRRDARIHWLYPDGEGGFPAVWEEARCILRKHLENTEKC